MQMPAAMSSDSRTMRSASWSVWAESARAAAIEAGIIIPFPSLQLKDPLPTAQKLLAKKGKEWCLQLLDELSALVFED